MFRLIHGEVPGCLVAWNDNVFAFSDSVIIGVFHSLAKSFVINSLAKTNSSISILRKLLIIKDLFSAFWRSFYVFRFYFFF